MTNSVTLELERLPMTSILFVDDEQNVLHSIERVLEDDFDIDTAISGAIAIERLKEKAYAIVVSDMRMPEMNGAKLLKYVYENHPKTIRILLTGQSTIDDVALAVNEGQIFRLLQKPCSAANLTNAINAAIKQRELMVNS